jgi:hypothetical protein
MDGGDAVMPVALTRCLKPHDIEGMPDVGNNRQFVEQPSAVIGPRPGDQQLPFPAELSRSISAGGIHFLRGLTRSDLPAGRQAE